MRGCRRRSSRAEPRGLALLRELWQWREREAIAANKPPFFVLSHELVLRLAEEAGQSENIESILPPKMSSRRRETLLQSIALGRSLPEEELPLKRGRREIYRPTAAEQKRFLALRQIRDTKAIELGIDPTLIASRSTLALLSQDWDKYQGELMNWQRELLTQ